MRGVLSNCGEQPGKGIGRCRKMPQGLAYGGATDPSMSISLWFIGLIALVSLVAGSTASVVGFAIGSLLTPVIAARFGTVRYRKCTRALRAVACFSSFKSDLSPQ
jgi:hypothetical protein